MRSSNGRERPKGGIFFSFNVVTKIIESPHTFNTKLEAAEATLDSNADYVLET